MKGLGRRIQLLRKERGLTLVQISRKTSIDQATLSRIENGKMTGTLDSHMRIAQALGIGLPELYRDALTRTHEEKETNTKQKIETFFHSSGTVAEILTSGFLQKKMMPLLLKIKPKGHTESEESPAGTERFIYVLKGRIHLAIGKENQSLKAGENLYFNATVPHHFKNPSKSEAWCLSVTTPTSL